MTGPDTTLHDPILRDLIALSQWLGQASRQLLILGEGNTSAACGDGSFWVKASGSELGTTGASGFSRVRLEPVLSLLDAGHLGDDEISAGLQGAVLEGGRPSVETFLHALLLTGARWVGHTHPVSVNGILCSRLGAEPFLQHIFPDAVVVCGKAPAVVPYVDPGLPLALAVRDELRRFEEGYGVPPKMLLMVNHGLVALGQTPKEVMNITLMADKWAGILQRTYALGGPRFLPEREVARIDSRADEHYRRRRLSGLK
jgi:rhamnose utilization protein RhaD (predicted bifunctional aldolase and dehydrogenase)